MDLAEMLASAKEQGVKEGYNQALEDFADLISKNSHIDFDECYVDGGGIVITTKEVFDLAEQLKR